MLLPLPHFASLPFREPWLAVSVPQTFKATSPLAAAAAAPTGAVARFGAGSSGRPRGGQLPRLRQGTYLRVRWAWTTQERARVLHPQNGVGHGRGADPQLPRRARHRRRRPEAPRRPATLVPPSTAASSRSSQLVDSLRVAQEPAPGTTHVRNGKGKAPTKAT